MHSITAVPFLILLTIYKIMSNYLVISQTSPSATRPAVNQSRMMTLPFEVSSKSYNIMTIHQ